MKITDLNGKTVCILGYGREGRAMVEALEQYAPDCEITIADQNEKCDVHNTKHWKQVGTGWLENLEKFDVIIKSPGIPPSVTTNYKLQTTNSTQIFLDSLPETVTVIGVTGSKGKSTTASLIHAILKEAGKTSHLLGNIGEPAISALSTIYHLPSTIQYVVLELSSYQLMDLTRSPQIAVVTSFFPEHLDYHGSLEAYKKAKMHITQFQTTNDTVFYYAHSEGAKEIAEESKGNHVACTEEDSPIAIIDTNLTGTHNLANIGIAASVARSLGITDTTIIQAVQKFEGLPHRLKNLGEHEGIVWIDDAISTTPESTIAALHALPSQVTALILGGKDRGNDFTTLGEVIDISNIQHVILMGESGKRIGNAIKSADIIIHEATTIEDAVSIARTQLSTINLPVRQAGYQLSTPICLLSPASPSYDQYKNFEEKGDRFAKAVVAKPQQEA